MSKVQDAKNAFSVLQYVATENKLDMNCTWSSYGAFVNTLGKIEYDDNYNADYKKYLNPNSEKHEFITIYTSVEKDFDVSGTMGDPITYKEKTLKPSGLGISSMSLEDGAIVYFTIATW